MNPAEQNIHFNPSQDDSLATKITNKVQEATGSAPQRTTGFGSGAEQDRHESHFGLGHDGMQRVKAAASTQGVGAEQDRHAAHFGLDEQKVQEAKDAMFKSGASGAEQDRYEARFGLGNDGLARVKEMAGKSGVGAEQDRHAGHFGLDEQQVEKAIDTVKQNFGTK